MTSSAIKGNMLIAQSGGPSMVINQSLVGAITEAAGQRAIRRLFGARHGLKGILDERLVDLAAESRDTLEAVAATPSSALGSVRMKPSDRDCKALFEVLRRREIRYFFYIGGNDSAETVHIVNRFAMDAGFDIRCFHIPKTIDNDLRANDHTPGYGSAARFVAMAVMGDDLDNRALPGIKIDVIMGRHAGFLTAAASLARRRPDDGPHLVYVPEIPFDRERFIGDVIAAYRRFGRCLVAVSEGITEADGIPLVVKYGSSDEVDTHGNAQLSGTGALGDMLTGWIKARFPDARVRADTFGYLQRTFPGTVSETDAREAREVGRVAVRTAVQGRQSGSIVIRRKVTAAYAVTFDCVPLDRVARTSRVMPRSFMNRAGNQATRRFVDYATPLVGTLPVMGHLGLTPVKKS